MLQSQRVFRPAASVSQEQEEEALEKPCAEAGRAF